MGFNGAADSRRRRRGTASTSGTALAQLQWGRRLSSTETCHTPCRSPLSWNRLQWGRRLSSTETGLRAAAADRVSEASMGPPTLVDGDFRAEATAPERWDALQWGRRLSSTETSPRCPA